MLCSFTIFQVNVCVGCFVSHKNALIDYEVASQND